MRNMYFYMKLQKKNSEDYLAHYGILGQKWGVRRYQNSDGSYTNLGKERYTKQYNKLAEKQAIKDARTGYKDPSIHKNVRNLQKSIFDKDLANTKEYKDYKKASQDLEDFEVSLLRDKTGKLIKEPSNQTYKKYDKLVTNQEAAGVKYNIKIGETYLKYKSDIYGAKLKDIGMNDSKANRELVENIYKDRFSSLDEATILRLIR